MSSSQFPRLWPNPLPENATRRYQQHSPRSNTHRRERTPRIRYQLVPEGGLNLIGSTRVGRLPWRLMPNRGPTATTNHINGRKYQHTNRSNPPEHNRQQELTTMGSRCLGSSRGGDAAITVLHPGGATHCGLHGPERKHNFFSRRPQHSYRGPPTYH